MTNRILESTKREHSELGYDAGATQHIAPFVAGKGWFLRGYSNTYSIAEYRIAIKHCHMLVNKLRWVNVSKWNYDNFYIIEVYDVIEINGEFYNKTVYKATARDLKMAIHLANTHKSDK